MTPRADSKDWSRLFERDSLAPPSFQVKRVESRDFDQFTTMLAPWNTTFNQITPGEFRGSMCLATAGGCQYFYLAMNQSLEAKALNDLGCFLFVPIHDKNSRSRYRTHSLEMGVLGILRPEQRINHFSAIDSQVSAFGVPESIVQRIGKYFGYDDAPRIFRTHGIIRIGDQKTRFLHRSLTGELDHLADSPNGQSPDKLLRMTVELIRDLLDPNLERSEFVELDRRREMFFRVVDTIKERLDQRITIQPICDELDISKRTLINLFQDMIGVTPIRYARALRYNQIRRDLKLVADKPSAIHAIARKWGIEYSGVFAAEYARHFGELPSATVRG